MFDDSYNLFPALRLPLPLSVSLIRAVRESEPEGLAMKASHEEVAAAPPGFPKSSNLGPDGGAGSSGMVKSASRSVRRSPSSRALHLFPPLPPPLPPSQPRSLPSRPPAPALSTPPKTSAVSPGNEKAGTTTLKQQCMMHREGKAA